MISRTAAAAPAGARHRGPILAALTAIPQVVRDLGGFSLFSWPHQVNAVGAVLGRPGGLSGTAVGGYLRQAISAGAVADHPGE